MRESDRICQWCSVSSVCPCYKLMRFVLRLQIPFVTKCQIISQCKQIALKCGRGQCVGRQSERLRGRGPPPPNPEIWGCPVEQRIAVIGRLVERGGSAFYQSWEFIPLTKMMFRDCATAVCYCSLFLSRMEYSNPSTGWFVFLYTAAARLFN